MLFFCIAAALFAGDFVKTDHYVKVNSIAPSMKGKIARIYVREVVRAGVKPTAGVVLFVHGAGTPAEVAFDVPYQDYSWMGDLAKAGFDVFSMDMTGYGRSTRPEPMNALPPSGKELITTIESDWNDISAVVDHLLKLRSVKKVNLVGWSLGGPRAGGYAAQHPDKVAKLVLLSPAYRRETPAQQTPPETPFNTQSRAEFDANWDRQLGCPDQFEPAARNSVWTEMLASDPLGAKWQTGVRRAPNVQFRGWDASVVSKMQIPILLVAPAHDKQVSPKNVGDLLSDYGAKDKVLVDLACASHNALWEKNHTLLFQAASEWLTTGAVNGQSSGTIRLGY